MAWMAMRQGPRGAMPFLAELKALPQGFGMSVQTGMEILYSVLFQYTYSIGGGD